MHTNVAVEADSPETIVTREVLPWSNSLNSVWPLSLSFFSFKHTFYWILFLIWKMEGFIKTMFVRERHNATESQDAKGKSCPLQWLQFYFCNSSCLGFF